VICHTRFVRKHRQHAEERHHFAPSTWRHDRRRPSGRRSARTPTPIANSSATMASVSAVRTPAESTPQRKRNQRADRSGAKRETPAAEHRAR
jgi:hypothetical protein